MQSSANTRFRSRHYPRKANKVVVKQEYAMKFYAMFAAVVMMLAVLRMQSGHGILWFSLIGMVLAVVLGSFFANAQMERQVAEILFVNDSFSIISVKDALHQGPTGRFPLHFSNPHRTENTITFTYEDRILTLKREDWEDEFDLIWNWFNQ
jgi:hypothetical protein